MGLETRLSKHNVLAVEPRRCLEREEELGTVGVVPGVCHGQQTRLVVPVLEVLVRKFGAVDRLAPSAVVPRKVTTLNNERLNQ